MTTKTVAYVEELYPGLITAETAIKKLDPEKPVLDQVSKTAVGFRTFQQKEAFVDGRILKSEPYGHSQWTYFGKILTPENVPPGSVLADNMRNNNYTQVVDVGANVWPLYTGDVVLPPRS